ncbi:hypothetical protein [Alteromonas gilva]|uniref:Flagellar hook-length control protein FliK n=1 Tax=Alteromonas gilva TaxID=2987522 RepID=A0ABT5L6I9_9ALTE|nr:hypothetical protein [Alteromonas gilva]MDC8832660.1 hypothetical protein [Alteromonas gilva]
MQPSQPTPPSSNTASGPRASDLPAAPARQLDVNRVAMPLQPVTNVTANAQTARQTSALQTPQRQTVQVSPAVTTSSADSLLLMKLPLSTPVQVSQQTTVELKTLLSQSTLNNVLPTLIKLSPESLSQPLSKTQIQSLVTVLAQAHRTPLSLPAEIVSFNNNTVHLRIGSLDGSGKQMIDIAMTNTSQGSSVSQASATKAGITALLASLSLPATATLTLTPLASNRAEWQAAVTLQSSPGASGNAPSAAAGTMLKGQLPSSSPAIHAALKAILAQGIAADIKSLSQWADGHLPAKSAGQLQRFSQMTPMSVTLKGDTLLLAGSRAQVMAVDTAPSKSLLNALPNINQQMVKQLNSQALSGDKLPRTELNYSQSKAAGSAAQTLTNDNVTLQDGLAAKTVAKTTADAATLKPEQATASLAQLKIAGLSPELKSALSLFIGTANRLNVVNTHSQSPNVASLVGALQKIANTGNAASDTSAATIKPPSESPKNQAACQSDKGSPAVNNAAAASVTKGTINAGAETSSKALHAVIAQLQLDFHSKSATGAADNAFTASNLTGEAGTISKLPVADTQQVSAAIKQLMTSAAWLQSPGSLLTPPAGHSFMSGLLQVLQVSLLGRHFSQHADLEQLLSRAKNTAGSSGAPRPGLLASLSGRQIREFAQLDSQQNLLKQLKGLLAGHQSAKLANLDQTLQGQDSFFYVLPALHQHHQSSELLIRREKDKKEDNEQADENATWNLTMKLNIGEQGELLSKVKIKSEQIFLDIYTSNQQLLEKVGLTLPFLLKRFSQLGLEVQEHKVQLGKIPDTLASKPFQLLETRA